MIIIGERINSSRKAISQAVEQRDTLSLAKEMKDQVAAGANMIDLNVGTFLDQESCLMEWLIDLALNTVAVPLSIDSPRAETVELALKRSQSRMVVNSITAETERLATHLPLIQTYHPAVIALCMDDGGLSNDPLLRCEIGLRLSGILAGSGLPEEDIYIDPLVQPLSCGAAGVKTCLETIRLLRSRAPRMRIICGLSNISYGLPGRNLINESFLSMAVLAGLDAVILNPLDTHLMSTLRAAEALAGHDEYCLGYISAYRAGRLACP